MPVLIFSQSLTSNETPYFRTDTIYNLSPDFQLKMDCTVMWAQGITAPDRSAMAGRTVYLLCCGKEENVFRKYRCERLLLSVIAAGACKNYWLGWFNKLVCDRKR